MQDYAIPCNTMQYHSIPCNTILCHAIPCNTMQYHASPCNTMHYHALPCNTMQYNTIPCNTMQYHASLITADGAYHCPVGSIMAIFSSVRSSNSHPDLLLTQHPTFSDLACLPLYNTDFHFLSQYSYIKSNHWTHLLATCILYGYNRTSLMTIWGHLGHYLGTTLGWLCRHCILTS